MERKPVYCAKFCTVAEIFEFIFGHKFNDIFFKKIAKIAERF